jgi:hypothetical protein
MPVSHFILPEVQRDMMHSLKTALVILPSTALISIVCACGPVVDVLHDTDAGAATGGSNGTTGTPTTGGTSEPTGTPTTGGASNPTGTPTTGGSAAFQVCGSLSVSNLDAVIQGETCSDGSLCDGEPGGCFSMAGNNDVHAPAAALVTCRGGQAEVMKMTALDVPATGHYTSRNDGVTWADCETALDSALTGQACTFSGKSCVRKTSDACCVEGIQCGGMTSTSAILERVRLCAPNCANLKADSSEPVVTDCASAAAGDCQKILPCSGDFICSEIAGSAATNHAFTDSDSVNSAMWCAGGILVGGYGFTWGI